MLHPNSIYKLGTNSRFVHTFVDEDGMGWLKRAPTNFVLEVSNFFVLFGLQENESVYLYNMI